MIELIRIVVDTAFLCLIWMTQLIVYPSFRHYSRNELAQWHPIYTKRISYFVAPFTFIQGIILLIQISSHFRFLHLLSIILFAFVLFLTFRKAIPLHQRLENEANAQAIIRALIKLNWYRALGWTIIWMLGLLSFSLRI